MANLTDTARSVIEGKKKPVVIKEDEKKKFDFFKKGADKDEDKKSDSKDDKDEDEGDKKSKMDKCKKLLGKKGDDKDVKEENIQEVRKEKNPEDKEKKSEDKRWPKTPGMAKTIKKFIKSDPGFKKEEEFSEVDTNNNPDRGAKAMKKFKGQWKRLLKMDIGDEVSKGTDAGEITGVITDFMGYDDGEVTDVVIEWGHKNEDGTPPVEEIIPVTDVEILDEDAHADYKAKSSHDRKVLTNKKNREHGMKKEDEMLHEHGVEEVLLDKKSEMASPSFARKLLDEKKKDMNIIDEDKTAAQDSLHPYANPTNDPKAPHEGGARLALISKMIGASNAMSDDECVAWLTKSLATIGHEADKVPNAAETNRATLKTFKPDVVVTGEDVAALFDGQELSEEFKTKTSVLFEAAVAAKAMLVEEKIEAAFAEVLQNQMKENEKTLTEVTTELNEKVEMYLDYVASHWLEENEIAVESALRTEMTTSFIKGLKDLFVEHYVDIPEEAVDVVEELALKNTALEVRLDALITEKHKMETSIKEAVADELFLETANGLAASQVEKFRVLAEDVEYTGNDEKYKEKLTFIREAHFKFGGGSKKARVNLEDSFQAPEVLNENVSPEMLPYVQAISRHIPRHIDLKKDIG